MVETPKLLLTFTEEWFMSYVSQLQQHAHWVPMIKGNSLIMTDRIQDGVTNSYGRT